MRKARLPKGIYESHKRLSDGSLRTYFTLRGFGALRSLPGDEHEDFTPWSPAFMRAYTEAKDAPRKARTAGTLQYLIDEYRKSNDFARLAPRTKSDYLAHLTKIEVAKLGEGPAFATYPLAVVEDPKIRPRLLRWRDKMADNSPRQADATLGVLRIILEFGHNRGLIAFNHARNPKKAYKANRSDKIWLPEHLNALRSVAPHEIRLAMEVALWTGQRLGDILRLGWSSYKEGRLKFRQGKRNRKVDMPVHSTLRALLDAEPRRATTILTTAKGKPWRTVPKPTHFQHEWRKAAKAAGIDGLHFHDIRGTTCTMLANAQCTPSEIASYLGWTVTTVNEMLDRYQAMTATQSDSAVAKLEARHR